MKHSMLPLTSFRMYIATLCLITICSCKKDSVRNIVPSEADKNQVAALREAVAASVGVAADKVEYLKSESQFVIEEDATVSLQDAAARFAFNGTAGGANGSTQKEGYYQVNPSLVNNIKIYADATVSDDWLAALDSAIENWNTSGSKVKMERIASPYGAHTKVTAGYLFSYSVAVAAYPDYYGNPGRRVTINSYYNYMPDLKKVFALTHELGHTIGFSHTNGYYGYLINGTPVTDPYSVMNSVCQYWSGFSEYDRMAVQAVYPE